MAKNSTLSLNVSVISAGRKNLKNTEGSDERFAPSKAVLTNILAFSKALRIEKSRQAGFIEVILN